VSPARARYIPGMRRIPVLLVLAAWLAGVIACSTAAGDHREPDPEQVRHMWLGNMRAIDKDMTFVEDQLKSPGFGDLRKVASSVTRSAQLVAQGYGPLEQKDVPDFAEYAHETESWLLKLAMEASLDHGELARELYQQADVNYCKKCHMASDKIHPRPRR
jgi:hypothetical protein